jgi:hypothetical protein
MSTIAFDPLKIDVASWTITKAGEEIIDPAPIQNMTEREKEIAIFSVGAGPIQNIHNLKGFVHSKQIEVTVKLKDGTSQNYRITIGKYELGSFRGPRWVITKFELIGSVLNASPEKATLPKSDPIQKYSEADLLSALINADYIITGGKNYTIRWTNLPNNNDRIKILDYLDRAGAALESAGEMARSLSNSEAISVISQCEGCLDRDRVNFNNGGGGKNGLRDAQRILRAYLKGK